MASENHDNMLSWACEHHDPNVLEPHSLYLGATRSGKTLSIGQHQASVCKSIFDGGAPHRVAIYDAKMETVPKLVGMGVPQSEIAILQPFDKRLRAPALADSLEFPSTCYETAAILCPEDKSANQKFFTDAVRQSLFAVFLALALKYWEGKAQRAWVLNDAIEIMMDSAWLFRVLASSPEGCLVYKNFFGNPDKQTVGNIFAEIQRQLGLIAIVARLWARSPNPPISIKEWMTPGSKSPRILLIGADETARSAIDALNIILFRTIAKLLVGRTDEYPADKTFLYLDEVREAGNLDFLGRVMTTSRTKGGHVILGLQSVSGLEDAMGSAQKAHEVLGQCGNVAILRLTDPQSRKWASEFFGNERVYARDFSTSDSPQGTTTSESMRYHEQMAVDPHKFAALPTPGPGVGLSGYFYTPALGAWRGDFDWNTQVLPHCPARSIQLTPDDAGFVPNPNRRDWEQRLMLSEKDMLDLGFAPVPLK